MCVFVTHRGTQIEHFIDNDQRDYGHPRKHMIHAPSPQHGCRQHREDAGMNVQGIRTEPGDLGQPYLGLPPGLRELGEISKVRKIHRETPTPKRDTGAADRSEARRVGKEWVITCRSRWSPSL